MIGRLSGEGGVTLVLAQQPVLMLRCCVVLWWSGMSPRSLFMLCHGREVSESGDIHTANSLGHRGHTESLALFRLLLQVFDCHAVPVVDPDSPPHIGFKGWA